MRAAVIQTCGRPPVVSTRPEPERRDGSALVAVTAAPITPLDVLCATGTSYFGVPALPYVPGVQGVGVVTESASLRAGTRVWFSTQAGMQPGDGSMAQLCLASETELVALPDGVEDAHAAALGLSAVAAWMAVTWRAALRPGERVLVLGASGTVGQVAVQAARLCGASFVAAACRSAAGQRRAREQGADAVVDLSPADDAAVLAQRLTEACTGPVDVVIDPLCGSPATAAVRTLGAHGRLVNLGSSAGETASFDSATVRSRSLALLGYTNNELSPEQKTTAMREVLDHAAAGRLRTDHERVPLEDATAAWSRQAEGRATSRLVLVA